MKQLAPLRKDIARALWIAVTTGFLASFLVVVANIVRTIDDPTVTTVPMGRVFLVWAFVTLIFGVISLLRLARRGASKP